MTRTINALTLNVSPKGELPSQAAMNRGVQLVHPEWAHTYVKVGGELDFYTRGGEKRPGIITLLTGDAAVIRDEYTGTEHAFRLEWENRGKGVEAI